MVIQRWQTVMLILAVCLMAAFCSTGFGVAVNENAVAESAPMLVRDYPFYLIANLAIALILFIAIFMYKKLKRQMAVTLVCAVLICASIAACFCIVQGASLPVQWTGGVFLLVGALICTLMAYNFMRKDHKLLTSYDRLR